MSQATLMGQATPKTTIELQSSLAVGGGRGEIPWPLLPRGSVPILVGEEKFSEVRMRDLG
jgi:hypothetical protein